MKIPIALFSCVCLMSACAPTHFVAPSSQPTRAAISKAQTSNTAAAAHAGKVKTHVEEAQTHAKTATTKIGQLEINLEKQPENLKLAQDVHSELDSLTQALLAAGNENQQTLAALQTTQANLADSQKNLNNYAQLVNNLTDKANKAIADANREKVKYHRLKFGACTLAAGLVAGVVFHFGRFLTFLGPWAWAALLGVPVAVWAALWFIL